MSQEDLAKNIIGIYQRHGRDWTKLRGKLRYEKVWLDRFLDMLPPVASVLDLGCGSGQPIAAYLLDRGCRVTGVDSSASMLDMARQRFPCSHWVQADMRCFQSEQTFQGILAWDSFFT